MLRRLSSSLPRLSLAAMSALATAGMGCVSEYELHSIENPLNLCAAGCELNRASYWHNPNEASQVGFAVEIAAWGAKSPEGNPKPLFGYTVNKDKRTAFSGAPSHDGGRVYYKRAGTADGLLAGGTPKVLLAPYADTSELGYALLAADVRNGRTLEPVGGILQFTGPKAFGEELIAGAPGTNGDTGEIYWYYSQATHSDPWLLGGAFVPAGAAGGDRFGSAIAMSHLLDTRYPDDVVTVVPSWIAVGAPGGDDVYILDVDPTSDTPFSVVQTIHGTAETGFGAALAVADFNDDGIDDLAIGSPGQNGQGRVHVYTGKTLGTPLHTSAHLDIESTLTGAGEHGASLAAGFFRRNLPGRPGLVVGDPGRDHGGSTDSGAICQYQFEGTVPMTVTWSRCDGASVKGTNYRFGHAVAVGNFFASNTAGNTTGSCATAEEIVVSSPGETEYSFGFPVNLANGAVRLLAMGEDGGETGETATQTFRGSMDFQQHGKAIVADYVQTTDHEDMLIGSPDRNGNRGSYALTRAELPNPTCSVDGKWTADADSDGNPFDISISWDGSFLHIDMLNDAALRAQDGGSVCSVLGFAVDFEGAAPIAPIPWTTCGVDHSEVVELDISDLVGFSAKVEGEISYDASSSTFTLDIDERVGILSWMNNNCTIVNNPFVFTQTRALACD